MKEITILLIDKEYREYSIMNRYIIRFLSITVELN